MHRAAKLGVLAGAFMLIAASRGSDGFVFNGGEFARERVDVRVALYPDRFTLAAAAQDRGAVIGRDNGRASRPRAFTEIEIGRNGCTIHIVDPSEEYRPEVLGHELTHCLYGRWHS
jgi:hypothetical protein